MSRKIHFDNPRESEEITGRSSGLQARVAQTLGVRLTTRDTWLEIDGDAAAEERAERFFETMIRGRRRGVEIKRHQMIYALHAFEIGREGDLAQLADSRIPVSVDKQPIFPQTFGQQRYVQAIKEMDIVFGIGPAGTGKTYLAMAMAVNALVNNDVSRIILTRPAIEAGEALGFLPGDMHAKVLPYLRPLYDALYDMMKPEDIERKLDRGEIEVAPLAYMRGRTLNHSFVLLDEAQNATREQMLMFLTRLGFDSKCVITGDLSQMDLPDNKPSGLQEAISTLGQINGIAITRLDDNDVVRHELVQQIIRAYRERRGSNGLSDWVRQKG